MRPTPTYHLPILSGIPPVKLCRLRTALFSAYRGFLDLDQILYGLLSGSSDVFQERLGSRCPFVLAAQNLLNNLAKLSVCASQWKNYKWNTEYFENTYRLCGFTPMTSTRTIGMSLPQTVWVRLHHLQIDGRFYSYMHKWGHASLQNCKCRAPEQTVDHVFIDWASHGLQGLTVLDEEA